MAPDSKNQDERSNETRPESGAAEAARLRERIDRGGAGDKVAFSDPAAAPLGTDAEAAGAPPTPTEAELATAEEAARAKQADHKRDPATLQGGYRQPGALFVAALVVLLLIALLFFVVL